MTYTVLVAKEIWHCFKRNRHIAKGETILDPAEVKDILATRPHHIIKRAASPDEAAQIEAMLAPPATPAAPSEVSDSVGHAPG